MSIGRKLIIAELKTKPNDQCVDVYLTGIVDESRRKDCKAIVEIMKQITNSEPKIWGDSIVGFGSYYYKYKSGREGDWFLVGFSSRIQNLTLYISYDIAQCDNLLSKLGKYKTGKGCLYIKKLDDINLEVLIELIEQSVKDHSKVGI